MTYEIKYRREEDMKDSGIEWLGMVPKDWEISKLKRYIDINSGREILDEKDKDNNKMIDVYGSGGVFKKTSNILYDGKSVLFGRKGTIGKPIYIEGPFWTVDTMYYSTCKNNFNSKLLYYLLIVFPWDIITTHTALPSVVGSAVGNVIVSIPEINYQQKIANFLDIKTSEIDSIISKKEKLIKKLEESKKSLISEVVAGKVKIVDGEILERKPEEMKDSGVEWIGMIPKDWEVGKLRWYLNCKSGDFIKNVEVRKEGSNIYKFPVIGGNGIMGYSKKYNTIKDVIAIGRVGALCGNVHLVNYKSWITDNSLIISHNEKKFEIKYLETLLRNINLNKYSTSTAQPLITGETIKKRRVVIPKLDEQQKNILYLETKARRINSIIKKTKLQIQKLKLAKQSLISEAVTGKIDLSDWEII